MQEGVGIKIAHKKIRKNQYSGDGVNIM